MKKLYLKISLAIFSFLILLLSSTNSVIALNLSDYFILNRNDTTSSVAKTYDKPATLVNLLVKNLFVIAGVIFFFMIIYSGFKFVYQGKKGAEEVKSIMTAAVAGLIIMFAAYWIVQIVEVVTGVDIIL